MIARVFPRRTTQTPMDDDVYIGEPTMFQKPYDEIHVSCTFTWDKPEALRLQGAWSQYYPVVKVGGPAFGDPGNGFTPGKYTRQGIVFTSRGCPNHCRFCFVPDREGKIRELPITEGNIVQDNNLLACSRSHVDKVFQMLSRQKDVDFAGGLEARLITDEIVDRLRSLRIYQIWLAYDHEGNERYLRRAMNKLTKYFSRNQLRCFVLIGFEQDTMIDALSRIDTAWDAGTLPMAMLYRDKDDTPHDKEWHLFQRIFDRPASTKAFFECGYSGIIAEVRT